MLLNVTCKKCGESFKLDIGDKTKKETLESLRKQETFSFCPGNHIEISSPINYLLIGDIVPGNAPSEKDFIENLRSQYSEIYENKEIEKNYEVSGFSFGCCICKNRSTGKKAYFDFKHSPKGVRYYYKIGED